MSADVLEKPSCACAPTHFVDWHLLLFCSQAFVIAGVYYMYAPDRPAPKKEAAAAAPPAGGAEEEDEAAVVHESSDSKPSTTRATRRRAA